MHAQPTPYADVNEVLDQFLADISALLGPRFVGMYVYGSLALGDFDPRGSDIDFVVVTDSDLSVDLVEALHAMHDRFNAGDSPWTTEVEAIYISRDALRRYDPARARHPHIQRGETLVMHQIDSGWIPLLHIIREHGITLAGPDPRTLIDPVDADALRRAVAPLAESWFGPALHDRSPLRHRGFQTFCVLTLCRILYTLDSGAVVSKPVAARWVEKTSARHWAALIERSLIWRKARQDVPSSDELDDTVALIQYTIERCRDFLIATATQ